MSELANIIRRYRYYFYQNAGTDKSGNNVPCAHYVGNDECSRSNGCYCKKMAEVLGYIDNIVPEEYRQLTINNANGFITDREGNRKQVWTIENKVHIQKMLREYLFGGAELFMLQDRESCNLVSKMDERYANGESIIIHGSAVRDTVRNIPIQPLPTGRTLIASLIIKEAIWRRLYKSNRADTYGFISYQNLKNSLKNKDDSAISYGSYDWLVIDDISLPADEKEFNHMHTVTYFDDFLMTRIDAKLPTILVCDFDATARDYTNAIGFSFQKLVTMKSTWLLQAGGMHA
jgi:hypothetical protein